MRTYYLRAFSMVLACSLLFCSPNAQTLADEPSSPYAGLRREFEQKFQPEAYKFLIALSGSALFSLLISKL